MTLHRRDVVRQLLAERGNTLVVAGLGASAWDVAAAGDDDRNFYLWGAMGGAAMVGLGLALDNGRYGETGMQPSHTAGPTRLAAVASACGIDATYDIENDADLDGLMRALAAQTDLLFARVAIAPEELPRVLPERDGRRLKARFRAAISVGGERMAGG